MAEITPGVAAEIAAATTNTTTATRSRLRAGASITHRYPVPRGRPHVNANSLVAGRFRFGPGGGLLVVRRRPAVVAATIAGRVVAMMVPANPRGSLRERLHGAVRAR